MAVQHGLGYAGCAARAVLRAEPLFCKESPPMAPVRWQPDRSPQLPSWNLPPMGTAIGRGILGRCPSCGQSHLFNGYLRVVPECSNCHAPLGLARADDAPPYFTILLVGHIVVPLILITQREANPPSWLLSVIFLPLTAILALGLLRPVKGGTVGLMLRLNMLKSEPDGA
jgi:uncharacterized protein (DUF983 family)